MYHHQPSVGWIQIKQNGTLPTPRSGHTITTVGKSHYLFGGIDYPKQNKKNNLPKNQTYIFKITSSKDNPFQCQWNFKQCDGDFPMPRAYHSACKLQDQRILIFGGYYNSKSRYNDTFILKTTNHMWSQPPNQKSSDGQPKNAESRIGAPQPRANHTANFHNGKVYIFGGHGGSDYKRIAFNDLHQLDCQTFEWTKLSPAGSPPEPRGGHSAAIISNKNLLLIFGGWSFSSQFSNLMIYNIEMNSWEDPEVYHQIPKWNMASIMVPSIPHWKYFVFGGQIGHFYQGSIRTGSRIVNDMWLLDLNDYSWTLIDTQKNYRGQKVTPLARQSSASFYSADDQRIYIHGGWSNIWLGDLWCLPIGNITGPSYAIFQISPKMGQLTGRTKINIKGAGFKQQMGVISIRFSGGKGVVEVPGVFIDQENISCESPSFEQYGPRKTEVKLCFGKHDYTINSCEFMYFLNTKADKTIAYGPGLIADNAAGIETCFIIQARNLEGKNRESGSDEFIINIRKLGDQDELPEVKPEKSLQEMTEEEMQAFENAKEEALIQFEKRKKIDYEIVDNDDGSYLVTYKVDNDCELQITIQYKNQKGELEYIRGHKFYPTFSKKNNPKNNEINGPLMLNYLNNQIKNISEFLEVTKKNLEIRNKNLNEDVNSLLNVMNSLKEIQEKKENNQLVLDRVDQVLKMLEKKQNIKKENQIKKCAKLKEESKGIETMAVRVEKDIAEPKASQSIKTKQKIKKFQQHLKEYQKKLKKQNFYFYDTGYQTSKQRINQIMKQILQKEAELAEKKYHQVMFGLPQNQTEGCAKLLDQIDLQVKTMNRLWDHINLSQTNFNNYQQIKWSKIDIGTLQDEIKKIRNGLQPIKVSDRKCSAFVGIQGDIRKWAIFVPLIMDLKDPAMLTQDHRHWKKIKQSTSDFQLNDDLLLETIWNLRLYDIKEKIEDIAEMAKNQAKMEKGIKKVQDFWHEAKFQLVPHKQTNVKTLKMDEDTFQLLQQHQLQINTMLLSKYISYFQKIVEKWKEDLGAVYDVVQLLSDVQKTWSFLQNLFIDSEEVKKELPKQSQMFIDIDKNMKNIMSEGQKTPNIKQFCTIPGQLKKLQQIQKDLKICQKALNDFLDSKRRAFPRFYFVSVNDLLDILSNGNSPEKINRHMSKIFQAIEKLNLKEVQNQRPLVTDLISNVGQETVKLSRELKLLGKVEIYLQDVIDAMNKTLHQISLNSFKAQSQLQRRQWIQKDPAQITLLVNNIIWSGNVEQCFKKLTDGSSVNAMKQFYTTSVELLTNLIKMVQGELTSPLRQKIMCLITMDTHSRDVIDKLIQQNIKKADAFQWQSQLKFYWENNNGVIRIADAIFSYFYQYLGNGPRLVITPLTDRIYVTATQALHLKMGCAPAGPAGTGKTQTTKDLSNGVAKACYVFNCSSEMNYQSMGNIYKGLASSGCWGCFDEFNRLLPEVLSVCSVQFKSVTDAIKEDKKKFILQGDEISLNKTCGVFITMNPGYLGRAQLPEGLKSLFRPITVVVPDIQLICQNMLMAEGFVEAKLLAKKFVTLYSLCKDLLSKQLHYDWGLRAIKSVLVVAGAFKRGEPTVDQFALLMRALRDFNLPKIAFADLDIFSGLLNDLFPGINILRKRDMKFEKVIEDCSVENQLQPAPEFILKVVQLSQLLQIRHCVFVMGPPGAGKTTTWKTLGKAQDKVGKKTIIVDINPKVVTTKDLYGYNLPSKEWKDGLLSKMMRTLSEMADNNPKWLLLDGDLDTNWIESMNSVMDDNKILTLANNERIPLKSHMRMIFEIRDLRFASPATVSRAGILYISDDSGYQWDAFVKSWLMKNFKGTDQVSKSNKQNLTQLFQRYIKGTLNYMKKHTKTLVPVSEISMIISLCKILEAMLNEEYKNLEYPFVFGLVWACGGCLAEKDSFDFRKQFSTWWKNQWKSAVKFPSKGTIFDYYIDNPKGQRQNQPIKFDQWTKILKQIVFDTSKGDVMGNITVQTKQTIATQFIIKRCINVNHPVLMIGFAGCGKTQLSKGILRTIVAQKPDSFAYQQINFNFYTDAAYLLTQLEQQLQKKAGRQYGPPGKVRLIYYIDDLNMPQLDQYDTQNAISLLRQLADYEHWYDIAKLTLKDIINTQTIASMNPSAGSFFVNPRYQRHFWTVSIPFPDMQSLYLIYSTFLLGHLRKFKQQLQNQAPNIIKSCLTLHQSVIQSFRKTAINFHYEFNLRHISNIFNGMLLSDTSKFNQPQKFVQLWVHQSQRTYGDRLVSPQHLIKYNASMYEIIKKSFVRYQMQKFFAFTNPQNLLFCNFPNGIGGQRMYDRMPNKKLRQHIEQGLRQYNNENAVMNLVLFQDAMKHILRITRIIMTSSGHALLVGVGGSGKQSLSKLSAFMMFMSNFSIVISSTYGMGDLKNDLQFLYNKTGVKEEGYLFLFTQGQISNERFLVYINDLLSSGEIADLYNSDQKEVIINSMRSKCKGEGIIDTKQNCWNFYINKVKQNLHMSLCFSPVGDSFRRRARQFPALINCTVIDWFFPWPKDALYDVANRFLEQKELGDDSVHKSVVSFMPTSFEVVNKLSTKLFEQERRYVYTTPKSFLQLITLFCNMLDKKRDFLLKSKERYENGLSKLKQTAETVAIIEIEVSVKKAEAQVKKKSSDEFAEKVGIQRAKVEVENNKAEEEKRKCEVIKKDVEEKKASTQTDLENAKPLVQQAVAALNSISKKDFQITKSFASPPSGVPQVFFATMWLLAGYYYQIQVDAKKKPKELSWKAAVKLMKNPETFLKYLIDFKQVVDKNQVPAFNVQQVKKDYLERDDFDPKIIENKSKAAAGLCLWVINIVKFYDVIQDVGPKRKALQEAKNELKLATEKLEVVENIVEKLNAQLTSLNSEYQKAVNEKNFAIKQAERCARRLDLAQRLISALGSQNQRWKNSIYTIQDNLKLIVGDVLMSSAFISYAGPFNKKFRDSMIQGEFMKFFKVNNIPCSYNLDPVKNLTDESTIALWNKQTLPSDKVSVQNGTILTNSQRYSLMVDPQLQGLQWIREKEKSNKLKSLRLGSKNINRELQVAIENGYSALIENMGDKIDAIIMPVVSRSFIKKGKNKILKFAGKDLILHKDFKLFLQTKLSNPHYTPQVQAQAALINFTVTQDGLGDQLLSLVVARQRPDLSKKKNELIQQQNDFKIKLKQLQDQLLFKLANAQGDILDDISLIENLQDSKRISVEISEKVQIAKVTQAKINYTSEKYRPAANRGALFYFLLSDLYKIHSFYKFSLQAFIDVINRAIDNITQGIQKGSKMVEVDEDGVPIQKVHRKRKLSRQPSIINKSQIEKKQRLQLLGQKIDEAEAKVEEQSQMKEYNQKNIEEKTIPEKPKQQKKVIPQMEEIKSQSFVQKFQQKQEEFKKNLQDQQLEEPLSPRSLVKRVQNLIDSISITSFIYTRRGLFEKHKLIVAAMFCFRIMIRKGQLSIQEVEHLIIGKVDPNPPSIPQSIKGFITQSMWAYIKGLEIIPCFNNLGLNLDSDMLQWKKWYGQQRVEDIDLPKAYKDISDFNKILLYRAIRPDRLTSAIKSFVHKHLSEEYVEQTPFNIIETFDQTDKKTPMFFVLFPGVDPTPDVERAAAKFNISIENGKFTNISMGQGQQAPAKKSLFHCAEKGYWIMLQNLHLMQNWLYGINGLQGFLEQAYLNCHPNFRVFLSSQPPPLSDLVIIPQSILQSSIKISNEAPQYLKANLRRAYAKFDQEFLNKCDKKQNEFKACLFALCYFHSLVVGRKKFGSQGWSRTYNFNDGDLTICADVLYNYLSKYEVTPYQDLKYIFGQIMYGGHITDDWDRRTNITYLKVLMRPELMLPNFSLLYHLFKSPDPARFDYKQYRAYIEEKLPPQVPQMFGMHPNAQIGYLTQSCIDLCNTILETQGGTGGPSGAKQQGVVSILMDLKQRTPGQYNMIQITGKSKQKTPHIVVCFQQCQRMNILLSQIRKSLEDLRLGLSGALNITDQMQNLQNCLQVGKVPVAWQKNSYPSKKNLTMWFNDLLDRNIQLDQWTNDLILPKSLCISYLFNPMSFLTAIMQVTARSKNKPLDNMCLQTNITSFNKPEEIPGPSQNGAFIHGLYLEGAAWQNCGPGQPGYLIDQKPKQLHPRLPVMNVIAVPLMQKVRIGQYRCPVYYTTNRGPTYIFEANLNMQSEDSDPNKWVLSGTCLLLNDD